MSVEKNIPEYVYRVAKKSDVNKGMYTWHRAYEYLFELSGAHPGPFRDEKMAKALNKAKGEVPYDPDVLDYDLISDRYFGFVNLEQLKNWVYMPEWREELDEDGFHIFLIKPEKESYIEGNKQCIFNIDDVVGTMTMLEV